MPFQSKAQRGYLWKHNPTVARRWEHEYKTPKNLPEHKPSAETMKHVVSSYSEKVRKKGKR